MPWQETAPMPERVQFIAAYLSQMYSMTALCERFGMRRHTGCKGGRRSAKEGPVGLEEKSRAPHHCPHRLAEEVEGALLEAKRAHPPWGLRKSLPSLTPRRPEQNRAPERMPRTLKAAATRPPARHQEAQQARFDRFCRESNAERPHAALGYRTPASRYRPSLRPMPAKLPALADPGHVLGRRVSNAGTFRFQSRQLFISDTLLQEAIALEESGDGGWSIYFYAGRLARLDERDCTLYA